MRRNLPATVALLVVTLALAAGCSGGEVSTEFGKLDDDAVDAALDGVENRWRDRLKTDGPFTVHADARCYATTRDGRYAGQVACGPARRAGAGDGQVWTLFDAPASGIGDGKATVGASDKPIYSQTLPSGVKLWRPDGRTPPKDAADLKAPPLPQAQPGVVAVVTDLPTDAPFRELPDARLVSATQTLVVTGVTEVGAVPGSALNQPGAALLGPAPGERFLLARVTFKALPDSGEPGFASNVPTADPTTEVFAAVGDKRTPLKLPDIEQNLVVSVPTGGSPRAVLGLRTAGKDQTLSLLDGARTSSHPGQYRTTGPVKVDRSLPAVSRTQGQFQASYSMTVPSVVLSSWDRYQGWAPDGMTWIRVPYQSTLNNPTLFSTKLQAGSIAVSADGKALEDRTPAEHWRTQGPAAALFLAPGDVKAVHVKLAPVVAFTGSQFTQPPNGTAAYGVLEFDVTFP